jgi:hypothetical protein
LYLIYLDESGTPSASDPDPFYTLGGIVLSERSWKQLDNDAEQIKTTHKLKEIHTRKIWKGHRKSPHHKYAMNVIGDIYSLLARSDVTLLCVSIGKSKEYRNNPSTDIEFLAWELLIERLNICVDKSCKINALDEYGLIIMDEKNRSKDLRIRNYLKVLRLQGTAFQKINRIIEDPIFTPSHWRNLTQLADSIVCCVKFHLKNEPFFSQQFLTLENKFAKDSHGNIYNAGYKVW